MSKMDGLSRRERQIMDVIYRQGQATAAEVLAALPDPPSYSTVRALLRILEEKGHLRHRYNGPRYVFRPTVPRSAASQSALRRVTRTFFAGSPKDTVSALVDLFFAGSLTNMVSALIDSDHFSAEELGRLQARIEQVRQEGR